MKTSKRSLANLGAKELRRRQKARRSLLGFAEYTYKDYLVAPHLEALAAKLEAVDRGECKRLIVAIPPRHGKSELISIRFPCFHLAKHPDHDVVQSGYAESISLVHSRQARDVYSSPEMKLLYPHVDACDDREIGPKLPERQAAHEWHTLGGGSYYAVGVGGGLTGRGFNIGIIDDPVKDYVEAQSQVHRERVWDWYRTVFRTRAQPDSAIIIVMTRWHEDDLVGKLLAHAENEPNADQWEVLHFKALDGDTVLWPERYSLLEMRKIKASVGSRAFEALYQGTPGAAEGNIVKRHWFQSYSDMPVDIRYKVQSWDTAFKAKNESNYSVCTLWGIGERGYYLLDVWRGRVDFPELKQVAIGLYERDRPNVVLVEDAASGGPLIQEMQNTYSIPVLPIRPYRDKVTRTYAITPLIESGRVVLPAYASWVEDYINELCGFPTAKYDDQVDSTTQFLNWIESRDDEERVVVYDVEQDFRGLLSDI